MTNDKIKQYIAMIGGALGGVLLFLRSIQIEWQYLNEITIQSFSDMLISFVPLILVGYGVYKNQYLISEKAKKQEDELKKRGLK